MSTSASDTSGSPTTTTVQTSGSRIRKKFVPYTPKNLGSSTTTTSESSIRSTKYSVSDKQELAMIHIANKTNLSLRGMERKLNFDGAHKGNKIGHHKRKMLAFKATCTASVWNTNVQAACDKWLPLLNAEEEKDTSLLIQPSEEDLQLKTSARKRKATKAALEDMVLDAILSYKDAAEVVILPH